MKTYFIIQSYGRTATSWTNAVLNAHNDIICAHGPMLPFIKYPDDPKERLVLIHKNMPIFFNLSLSEYFGHLEKTGSAKAYGNIHGCGIDRVFQEKNLKINFAYLTRHPIPRIQSFIHEWVYEATVDQWAVTNFQNLRNKYIKGINIFQEIFSFVDLDSFDNWSFLVVLFYVLDNDASQLVQFDNSVYVQMERLTKDVNFFHYFISKLTADSIDIDSSYLEKVVNMRRKNASSKVQSAIAQYEEWKDWQRNAFKILIDSNNLRPMYQRLGYNLSFVK